MQTQSNGVNVSPNSSTNREIDRLTAEVEAQRANADSWDGWNIRLLTAAGLAAVLLAITAVGVSRSNRKLLELSDRLDKAKDGRLQADLRSKESEIQEAKKQTAELTAKNLQLEAAISPRRLSDRQLKALTSLNGFADPTVEIKSYANDTEGLVLASQILDSLSKSVQHIVDNRLTMQSAGSVSFGILVEGPDKQLVDELRKALSPDANLTPGSTVNFKRNLGASTSVHFGSVYQGPVSATITVGMKPIR